MIAVPVGAFDAFPQESVAVFDIGCFQVDSPSVGLETIVASKDELMLPLYERSTGRSVERFPAVVREMADGVDVSPVECEAAAEPFTVPFGGDGLVSVIPGNGRANSDEIAAETDWQLIEGHCAVCACCAAHDAAVSPNLGELHDYFPRNVPACDAEG